MAEKQLLFKPTTEELVTLDRNNIRWSDFCHKNIINLNNKKRDDIMDKIISRMLLVVVGCLIFALSPLLNDIFLIIIEWIIGTIMVIVGSVSTIYLYLQQRKSKRA